MIDKLHIYGDSYSDSYNEIRHWPNFTSYIAELEKKYKVTNFSKKGCSAYYVINKLSNNIKKLKNTELSDTYCFIALPCPRRLDLKFLNDQATFSQVQKKSSNEFKEKFVNIFGQENLDFIIKWNENNTNLNEFVLTQTLSVLALSKYYKKVLIWNTDVLQHDVSPTYLELIDKNVNSNQTMCYVPMEFFHIDGDYPNHFLTDIHTQMYDIIVNWIENENLDITNLVKLQNKYI